LNQFAVAVCYAIQETRTSKSAVRATCFMKSPGEDAGDAKQGALDYIRGQEAEAQKDQGVTARNASDIKDKSLDDFGRALHTVTDGTSPAHVDESGNPRDWSGLPTSPEDAEAVAEHISEEATISPQQMDIAVQAAQDAFGKTYGQQALQQAEKAPKQDQPTQDQQK